MQQSIDDRAVELPSKINTEALRRLYPLHIRAPSDMERLMRLVDTAHSRGVEIWLLAPPRSETASKLIGPNGKERLSEAVKQLASKLGCRLFSPAHFWPDNLFTDQAHLNIEGRARFLAELKAAAKEQL
jgi:hypothetical protein